MPTPAGPPPSVLGHVLPVGIITYRSMEPIEPRVELVSYSQGRRKVFNFGDAALLYLIEQRLGDISA